MSQQSLFCICIYFALCGCLGWMIGVYIPQDKIDTFTLYCKLSVLFVGAAIAWLSCLGCVTFYIKWKRHDYDYDIRFNSLI